MRFWLVVMALALVAAACGSSDASDAGAPAEADTPVATVEAADPTPEQATAGCTLFIVSTTILRT